jgi:hypothetical protein
MFIRVEDVDGMNETRVWHVGPFMPHGGSAVDRALDDLTDTTRPGVYRTLSVHTLFIAPGESDLASFK